jgi:hypothetical protein
MADGTWDHFLGAYAQVSAAQARLTPRNAATEIDRLILTAWREKLPVYLELPSDIAYLDIQVPAAPLELEEAPADAERLRSCAAAITARLAAAKSPAILVDLDADRHHAVPDIMRLAVLRFFRAAAAAPMLRRRPGYLGFDRLQRRVAARHADRRARAPSPAVRGRRLVPADRPGGTGSSTAATTAPTSTTGLAARNTATTC